MVDAEERKANMTRTILAVFYFAFHVITAHAESLDALVHTGGTVTGGPITYSNFSSSITFPTPSLGPIDVRATETGLDITITGSGQAGLNRPDVVVSYDVTTPFMLNSMSAADINQLVGDFLFISYTLSAQSLLNGEPLGFSFVGRNFSAGCHTPGDALSFWDLSRSVHRPFT